MANMISSKSIAKTAKNVKSNIRSKQNSRYKDNGKNFISAHAHEIPDFGILEFASGVLEQIGRMCVKKMETAAIIEQANVASNALLNDRTIKQVEAYLRHGRITGEWDKSLLTATREAASNTAKPVEGLTPADLIAIEALLRDSMTLYDILGEADRKGKPRERRNARMAEMYADKVKAAYEVMTGRTFPQITGDEAQ